MYRPPRQILLLAAIVTYAAIALLPRLGSNCLNDDEAQVAVLARNALRFGLPYASDGRNLVTREWGFDSNTSGVWTQTAWLPIYSTALSLFLLGRNAYAARLPSVVFAVCGVVGLYFLVCRNSGNRRLAVLSAALLMINPEFILYSRQCQWYTLGLLGMICCVWCYCDLVRRPVRLTCLGLGLSLGLLFYINGLIYISAVAGILLHLLWSKPHRSWLVAREAMLSLGLSVAIISPWLIYACTSQGIIPVRVHPTNAGYRVGHPVGGVWEAGQFVLSPLVLCGIAWRYLLREAKPTHDVGAFACLPVCLILGVCIVLCPLMCLSVPAVYGEFVPVLPAFSVVVAWFLLLFYAAAPLPAIVFGLTLTMTNAGELWLPWLCHLTPVNRHFAVGRLSSYQAMYIEELTHGTKGPVDRLVECLRARSGASDSVFVSFEAEPIAFHTSLRIVREIPFRDAPRFIVLRELRGDYGTPYESVRVHSPMARWERSGYEISWQREVSGPTSEFYDEYVSHFLRDRHYRPVRLLPWDTFRQNSPEVRRLFTERAPAGTEVRLWEHMPESRQGPEARPQAGTAPITGPHLVAMPRPPHKV